MKEYSPFLFIVLCGHSNLERDKRAKAEAAAAAEAKTFPISGLGSRCYYQVPDEVEASYQRLGRIGQIVVFILIIIAIIGDKLNWWG